MPGGKEDSKIKAKITPVQYLKKVLFTHFFKTPASYRYFSTGGPVYQIRSLVSTTDHRIGDHFR